MRVCFLSHSLSGGHGWPRICVEIVKAVEKKGVECILLLPKDGHEGDELSHLERHHALSSFYNNWRKPFKMLRDYVSVRGQMERCDLVHSLIEPYAPLASLAPRRKPVFMTACGTYTVSPFDDPLQSLIFRRAYRRMSDIFLISSYTEKRLREWITLDNVTVVKLGIDAESFHQGDVKVGGGPRRILSVGTIKERKGYETSVRAFAEVARDFADLEYRIVGAVHSRSHLQRLREICREHGLEERVRFLGEITDEEMLREYQECSLFLLTPVNVGNHFEGFGLVYWEAGACGKPVIGTMDCGAEDAIVHGKTGFLVPQRDVKATAEAITALLKDSLLAEEMGRNGRKLAGEMSWDRVAEEYIRHYEMALSRAKKGR